MSKEIWKDIDGYDGMYQVSNNGTVRSFLNNAGNVKNEPTLLKDRYLNGYKVVALYKNGNRKRYYVHRLVARNFVDNPNNKPEVNHIDGDKGNSESINLEWVSSKENQNHAIRSGLYNVNGENCKTSKLNKKQVLDIRKLHGKYTGKELADKYSVSESNISSIINRKSWRHI